MQKKSRSFPIIFSYLAKAFSKFCIKPTDMHILTHPISLCSKERLDNDHTLYDTEKKTPRDS